MELAMANGFAELSIQEMACVEGGGLGWAIASGVLTAIATVGLFCVMPPGTKVKTAGRALVGGILLTAELYEL